MKRLLLVVPFVAGLTACESSFESACRDFCDKGVECATSEVSDVEILECKQECETQELEGQRGIENGTLTEECYDAARDVLSCATGVSCAELRGDDTPAECQDPVDRFALHCDD